MRGQLARSRAAAAAGSLPRLLLLLLPAPPRHSRCRPPGQSFPAPCAAAATALRSWCAGLGGAFWSAYHELVPRAPGFEARADLYELYHKLNHLNLFGSGCAMHAASSGVAMLRLRLLRRRLFMLALLLPMPLLPPPLIPLHGGAMGCPGKQAAPHP